MEKVSTIVVHTFKLGDVEDPDLYAAEPLLKWQNSDAGKYIMEHAVETPWWERVPVLDYHFTYRVCAKLTDADIIFYKLKFE